MTLFDEDVPDAPVRERRPSRATRVGVVALLVAALSLLGISLLPTGFVIEQPGPVIDTLGTVPGEGDGTALITIEGAATYPTTGRLDLVTVQVLGDRTRTPSWLDLAAAWFDPAQAVLPVDAVYPAGQTTEQRNQRTALQMVDSQQEATAAALRHLGYDVPATVVVGAVGEDTAAKGLLEVGDRIVRIAGKDVAVSTDVTDAVAASGGAPVDLVVERAGEERAVTVTPRWSEADGRWLLGVALARGFQFPFAVTIELDAVGGPSAGLMFALGIMDKLTPGGLAGGAHVAGTGTIDGDGVVGPIGGIAQKMHGARAAGATVFLAPQANCGEVVGHVPDGLRVFAVSTMDDAIAALDAVSGGGDLDALPTCR